MSARTHNPSLRAFAERLEANGKSGNQIIVAVERKLLHGIHAMFHNGQPWHGERPLDVKELAAAA